MMQTGIYIMHRAECSDVWVDYNALPYTDRESAKKAMDVCITHCPSAAWRLVSREITETVLICIRQ